MKKRIYSVFTIIIILGLAFFMYLANHYYRFAGDDIWYSTNLVTGEPISSLSDIVQSQIWHYMNWGGRTVGHTMLQLVLWAGSQAADIINVVVLFVLPCLLMCYTGRYRLSFYFLVLSLIIGTTPGWETVLLWQAGVANYLYTSLFLFSFLMFYIRALDGKNFRTIPMIVGMVPLGLLAGWSNENTSPAILLITIAVIVIMLVRRIKVPAWMYVGSTSCLIGCAALILAPGNDVRQQFTTDMSFWEWLFNKAFFEARGSLYLLFLMLLIALFVFIVGKRIYKIPVGTSRILLLAGALLSWGAMILSPVSPDRTMWGSNIFLILFTLSYVAEMDRRDIKTTPVLFFGSLLLSLHGVYLIAEYYALSSGRITL